MLTALSLSATLLGVALVVPAPQVATPTLPAPLSRAVTDFGDRADLNAVVAVLESDAKAWSALSALDAVDLASIPLAPGIEIDASLRRLEPLASDGVIVFAALSAKGELTQTEVEAPALQCWAGTAPGYEGSRVFLAHCDAFTHGYAIVDGRTFIISSGAHGSRVPIVAYELATLPGDAIVWSPFECTTLIEGDFPQQTNEGGIAGGFPCRHVKIAIDSDNELAAVYGNNFTATAAYLLLNAAAQSEIYTASMNIRIQASFIRVWTTNDPWTASGSSSQLTQFRDYWQANMGAVVRDAAMLLSARGLGGGVAWLAAMCSPWAYSVSGNLSGFFPYPLQNNAPQNWDIMVTSHELGHNVGSPHTHNYCPPIDQCAPSGYFGGCQTEQVCTSAGTIMSYCHLCSGGLGNVLLDFAPGCRVSIDEHLASVGCEFLGAAQPPFAVTDVASSLTTPITIDVLANDLPVNCGGVWIHSFTQPAANMGSVALSAGTGPGGRDQLVFTAPSWFAGVSTFTYTPRNAAFQTGAPANVTVTVPALWPGKSVINTQTALNVQYFDLVNPQALPYFDLMLPYLTTTTPNINYPSTGGVFANSNKSDNFGAVWTGWIWIPEGGLWTLFINSDDGSRLLIDDVQVINNDGLHGMVEKSTVLPLGHGRHRLRVEFFEAGGGAGCILSMSGPGMSKIAVPAANCSRGGNILTADLNIDGVVNGADLAIVLGLWNTSAALADLNNNGVVDGADLAIILGQWTN